MPCNINAALLPFELVPFYCAELNVPHLSVIQVNEQLLGVYYCRNECREGSIFCFYQLIF